MPTAYITQAIEYTEDGEQRILGSKVVAQSVAYDGNVFSRVVTVAVAGTEEILRLGAASTDDLADADVIAIQASQDGMLEFIGTNTADNSNLKIGADRKVFLGPDGTLSYNAGGNFSGSDQNVTSIKYRNDGASLATVRVLALT